MVIVERKEVVDNTIFGSLWVEGSNLPEIFTLEDASKRIQPGAYDLESSFFYSGGYSSFEIAGVPDRSRLLIHIGNTASDVRGCVAVGLSKGNLSGKPAVLNSADAYEMVHDVLEPRVPCPIVITDVGGNMLKNLEASPLEPMPLEELETADIKDILNDKGFWDFTE